MAEGLKKVSKTPLIPRMTKTTTKALLRFGATAIYYSSLMSLEVNFASTERWNWQYWLA